MRQDYKFDRHTSPQATRTLPFQILLIVKHGNFAGEKIIWDEKLCWEIYETAQTTSSTRGPFFDQIWIIGPYTFLLPKAMCIFFAVCVCTQTIPFCRQKPYNTIHWWVYMVNIYHGLAAIDLVRICSYKSKILHVLGLSFLTCRLAAGMVSSKVTLWEMHPI